jgi:hypothetical protein
MSKNIDTSKNGLGISTILFLIFLTLKLAEVGPVAHWSWLWVLSPLWIPLVLMGTIVLIVLLATFFIK